MNAITDNRITAFRECLRRFDSQVSSLHTVNIAIMRRDELPGLLEQSGASYDGRWLREEMATAEHPLALRNRRVRVEQELRQIQGELAAAMLAALDAARQLVTEASGGLEGVAASPFVRNHLRELAHYRSVPVRVECRQMHFHDAWLRMDAAIAAVPEIRHERNRM